MELTTDRLLLRPWQETEAAVVLEVLGRRDVAQWLSDDWDEPEARVSDLPAARERIRGWHQRARLPGHVHVAVVPRDTGVPVGSVSVQELPNAEHGELEIGWWLHPDAHGRGYASEAARAVMAHSFGNGTPELWAVMYVDNLASAAVARRLGMTDTGVHERWYSGESRIFGLTREEWRASA